MTPEQIYAIKDFVDTLGVPICILVFLALVVWRLMPDIRNILTAMADERRGRISTQAEANEIQRHNNAVIENNTAALTVVANDRELTRQMIEQHDKNSEDRMCRIEGKTDTILRDLDLVITDLKIVKERSPHSVCRYNNGSHE